MSTVLLVTLLLCNERQIVLLQKNVHATRFVEYVCLQVLPVLSEVGGDAGSDVQLELLKLLAEMVVHCGELSSVDRCTASIYDCLLASLPLTDSFLIAKIYSWFG